MMPSKENTSGYRKEDIVMAKFADHMEKVAGASLEVIRRSKTGS
jgi:hypothetical protein